MANNDSQQSQIEKLREDLAEFKASQFNFNDAVELALPGLEPSEKTTVK